MGNNTSTASSAFGEKSKKCSINDPTKPRPGYYTNGHEVYYCGKQMTLLPGEIPSSFKKLGYSYAKTNKCVFYKGVPIDGTDPATFVTIDRKQQENILLPPHQKAIITRINGVIGRDRHGIYFQGKIIIGN